MTVGLQGAGKTTAVAKMALFYRKKANKKPFLIAADIYRPAAIDQLVTLGKQINVPVFEMGIKEKPENIVKNGLKEAQNQGADLIIIDTAGRLHIDEALMEELQNVQKLANPDETLLTVDAMIGQDAVNVAKSFNDQLKLTGCILTKMDGDTRGGAALSIKHITGIPIKLMSTGEKLDALEIFHPDRLADRILGMGDVLSLIDTVTENVDEDEMMNMTEKLMSGKYNYNDLLKQFKMIKRMGSISKILGFLPGMKQIKQAASQIDSDKAFSSMEEIIKSMTEEERKNPQLINTSATRRERIAKGSGHSVMEVNRLREALDTQIKTMKKMQGMSQTDMQKMASNLQNGNLGNNFQPKKGKGKGKGNFRF
jgi:signal recognition particle subunit SRP54